MVNILITDIIRWYANVQIYEKHSLLRTQAPQMKIRCRNTTFEHLVPLADGVGL